MTLPEVNSRQDLYSMLEPNAGSYRNIPLSYKTEEEMYKNGAQARIVIFPCTRLLQGLLEGEFRNGNRFSSWYISNENPKDSWELFKKYFEGYEQIQKLYQIAFMCDPLLANVQYSKLLAKFNHVSDVLSEPGNYLRMQNKINL